MVAYLLDIMDWGYRIITKQNGDLPCCQHFIRLSS